MHHTDTELATLIATRRDLHRHPELGFQEHRTAGIVAERLRAAGYDVQTGIAETGVVGTLRGGAGAGPTLLLRADMDALPITEETTHDFRSTVPGRMHACGHDAHVAIGLAVAERLAARRGEWGGEVRYLFQPAEEGGSGALRMVNEGVLEGVDAALGLHVWLGLPERRGGRGGWPTDGRLTRRALTVRGRGGHGSLPHETVDAVYVASQIVVALQSVVARNVSPLETAVGLGRQLPRGYGAQHHRRARRAGGHATAFRVEVDELLCRRVREVAEGVAAALGAECEVDFGEKYYPPTVERPRARRAGARAAAEVVGAERVRADEEVRTTGAETSPSSPPRVPAATSSSARARGGGAVYPHHSPRFDLAEDALPRRRRRAGARGARVLSGGAEDV